jgi:hypothetical protein
MKPHKHAELIKAWADGYEIEYRYISKTTGEWFDWKRFDGSWSTWVVTEDFEYRIKPEPKPDVSKLFVLEANLILGLRFSETLPIEFGSAPDKQFLACTFDGETGKLKSAEVLK